MLKGAAALNNFNSWLSRGFVRKPYTLNLLMSNYQAQLLDLV